MINNLLNANSKTLSYFILAMNEVKLLNPLSFKAPSLLKYIYYIEKIDIFLY